MYCILVHTFNAKCSIICYVILCLVMLCYVMLCYVMLCYVMLCYVMLCYVMLCYVLYPTTFPIMILRIRFDLGLGHKFGGGFMVAAEIDLTIFGNRMHFGAQFSLNDPVGSIISAKDSALYNYKEGVRQARTSVVSYDPYDPPNPFSDFDLSGEGVCMQI